MTSWPIDPRCLLGLLVISLMVEQGFAARKSQAHEQTASAKTGSTEAALTQYLQRVREAGAIEVRTAGSIWTENGNFTRLSTDVKAMHPHDLISILVAESLSATTDGSVKNTRASNANSQVASLFGKLSAGNNLQALLNQNAASGLNAQGQSTTDSSLNTVVGGEVVDVLPSGILVIEADRQVSFNQQTQIIRMRGLVRPEDVSPLNQVLSTTISNL